MCPSRAGALEQADDDVGCRPSALVPAALGVAAVGARTPRRARPGSRPAAPTSSAGQRTRSWAAVRAPTIGAATPGPVAHPGQRDLERRRAPSPSAAVATASTIRWRVRRRGSGRRSRAKCGDAPRESAGVPVRYLPVSTPAAQRGPGQQAEAEAGAAGSTSRSTPRSSSEYSTWVARPAAPRPGTRAARSRPGRSASRSSWRRRRSGPGRWSPRCPGPTASPPAGSPGPGVHLPQVDVVGAEPAQRARPARRAGAPREASTRAVAGPARRCPPWSR